MRSNQIRRRVIGHAGVTVNVPMGWDARVLYLDSKGDRFVVQLANFNLAQQHAMGPPPDLSGNQADPIVAMRGGDTLDLGHLARHGRIALRDASSDLRR